VCRCLHLPHFAHSPMPGDNAAATQSRPSHMLHGLDTLDRDIVFTSNRTVDLALAPVHKSANSELREHASKYARVHLALAQLHAKHVQAGDDFIGHNVLASPAQGLFHLRTAAEQGSLSAMLTLSCLQLQIRPRKGVMRALSSSLQQPLERDETAALPNILRAAERGITSAMAAAGYAYEHGLGCQASALHAAQWYERALKTRGGGADPAREDLEGEGERLPGGGMLDHEMFEALAALYENGSHDLLPNPQQAWQFRSLARSSARREQEGDSDEDMEATSSKSDEYM